MIICTDAINLRTILGLASRSNGKVIAHITNIKTTTKYRVKLSTAAGYMFYGKSPDNNNIMFNVIGNTIFGFNINGDDLEYPIGDFIIELIEMSSVE